MSILTNLSILTNVSILTKMLPWKQTDEQPESENMANQQIVKGLLTFAKPSPSLPLKCNFAAQFTTLHQLSNTPNTRAHSKIRFPIAPEYFPAQSMPPLSVQSRSQPFPCDTPENQGETPGKKKRKHFCHTPCRSRPAYSMKPPAPVQTSPGSKPKNDQIVSNRNFCSLTLTMILSVARQKRGSSTLVLLGPSTTASSATTSWKYR